MKTVLYYFTGTGNSLAAAKKISAALGDCELMPIASLMPAGGDIVPAAERVGIICPVYFSGLPVMVAAFARRLELSQVDYVFSVVTMGSPAGSAALLQLDSILRERHGRGLDAGFGLTMPGNYILLYSSPEGEKQREILRHADTQIAAITGKVMRCERQDLPSSLLSRVLYTLVYGRFASRVHTEDRKFSANEKCISCGICAAICPAGNIALVAGKPVWQHRCELCCGCIHACPVQAIQAGSGTEKRFRYRNPDVTVDELKFRKRGSS